MEEEDDRLIEKIKTTQSSAACRTLVDKYRKRVFSFCYRIVKNREVAEEIAQDSFLKALTRINDLKDVQKFFPWLMKITYHMAIDYVHKKKMKFEAVDSTLTESSGDDPHALVETKDRRALIEHVFLKFPEKERVVLMLYYLEDFSVKQIEEVTGLSVSNIKVRLFRGREELKKELQKIATHL